jgi:hypothetical protein
MLALPAAVAMINAPRVRMGRRRAALPVVVQGAKLKRLIEKRAAVNARIKKEQNWLRERERKSDTWRKILAGAAVLQWAARDSDFAARLMVELKAFLARDADRALFGLPPVLAMGQERPETSGPGAVAQEEPARKRA